MWCVPPPLPTNMSDSRAARNIFLFIGIVSVFTGAGVNIWNIMTIGTRNQLQDTGSSASTTATNQRFEHFDGRLQALNATILDKLTNIIHREPTNTTLIEAYIVGNTTMVLNVARGRILTLNNGVYGDENASNVNIRALDGLEITETPHGLALKNTGVLSLTAGQGVVLESGSSTLKSTGVRALASATGPTVDVVGEDGLETRGNASTIVISGLPLQMAIANVSASISLQATLLCALLTRVAVAETRLTIVETVTYDVNQTIVSINDTLLELFMRVEMLEYDVNALVNATGPAEEVVPVGTVLPWGGSPMNVPHGYLYCDGALLSATTYAPLFSVIGTSYCVNAPSPCGGGQFALPDMRGKALVGGGDMVGSVAGTEKHTLVAGEMPTHAHVSNQPTQGTVRTTFNFANPDAPLGPNALVSSVGTIISGSISEQSVLQNIPGGPWYGTGLCPLNGSLPSGWKSTASGATADVNGQCNCNDAPTIYTAYSRGQAIHAHVSNPNNEVSCSALQYDSSPYTHTHANSQTGGSMSHTNVQPSLIIGGYMIKT